MTPTHAVLVPRHVWRRSVQDVAAKSALTLSALESRPTVQLVVLLRLWTAAIATGGTDTLSSPIVWTAAAAWVLANSAVYLFNGLNDMIEDRANGKDRPLSRGALDPRDAWAVLAAVVCVSLALAALTSTPILLLTVGLVVAGLFYSWTPTPLLRNPIAPLLFIAFGGAGTYTVGVVASGGPVEAGTVVLGLVMTGWMTLVGGIVKDLADVEGDTAAGRRTLTVLVGTSLAGAVGGCAAVLLGVAFVIGEVAVGSAALLVPAIVLLMSSIAVLVATRSSTASPQRPYVLFMRAQYAVHVSALLGCAAS
ncbi:UbiA prenyltransferase family protein [Actinomycetes bacterium M1A6_2h]